MSETNETMSDSAQMQRDLDSIDAAAALRHAGAPAWIYRGVWSRLVKWLRVPHAAPTLPAHVGEFHRSFQPSAGFLRYLKFQFWLTMVVIYGSLIGLWIVLLIFASTAGVVFTAPLWALIMIHGALGYVALHLRYDTTWYVMTDRSLRLRRGVWSIHEITITFENVQHVRVKEGPLQRWFGIADVEVQTAGGSIQVGNQPASVAIGHIGIIQGVSNAREIRDLVLAQLRASRSAGLGDEAHKTSDFAVRGRAMATDGAVVESRHLEVLREIRTLLTPGV